MNNFSHTDLILFLGSIGAVLLISRVAGELLKKLGLPLVMGQVLTGIVLGPTIFGAVFPGYFSIIFPDTGGVAWGWEGLTSLSVILLMFIIGLEVQMPQVLSFGKRTLLTGGFTVLLPMTIGVASVYFLPKVFGQIHDQVSLKYALLVGAVLTISALPVLAKTLIELRLFSTRLGSLIMGASIFNNLIVWMLFSFLISLFMSANYFGAGYAALYIVGFTLLMTTIGKILINRSLPWIQTRLSWPGGVVTVTLAICLLAAAFTHAIHLHALLGAFIAGMVFGESVHFHEKAREIIHQFVTSVFAPLFFVSIGLKLNITADFNIALVVVILLLSVSGKIIGAMLASSWDQKGVKTGLGVGAALSGGGSMVILLSSIALGAGMIQNDLMIAVLVTAIATSWLSAPVLKYLFK